MYLFNCDLDNTLIYSYKHDIGADKINVEQYQGREISFITSRTFELLKEVAEKTVFVPTTTRTVEQYGRIDLGIHTPQYALVCNGGILLKNGVEDSEWYLESLRRIQESKAETEKGFLLLRDDGRRIFDLRLLRDLFVFTKCNEPELVVKDLRNALDTGKVDVFHNGVKVYIVPKRLNKGEAVARLKARLGIRTIIAAGDSEFDLPMLERADYAIAPDSLRNRMDRNENICFVKKEEMFSEKVLEQVIVLCRS